ncbi:hypothetical protein HMPREF0290_2272 [Corynebacterium efficiens YS-314]|nr:hypothetical protein [Corynebacterium efficiens]EEW49199.1 hypothetical protein HMPREF0290_2272 [Corynebacterium efficiens YS-314]
MHIGHLHTARPATSSQAGRAVFPFSPAGELVDASPTRTALPV